MEFFGVKILSDPLRPTDTVTIFSPSQAVKYKEFTPITSAIVIEEGVGKKVRVWAEGEFIRQNALAVFKLTDVIN